MRISTSAIYDVNVSALNQQQYNLLHTQQQVSSGRRILTPADDPAGAARALEVTQADGTNSQYLSNIGTTNDSVALSESTLQGVTSLIQSVQTLAVNAGDPVLADSDRKALAVTLQNNLDQLLSMANSKDGVGNYLFSGFKGSTQPFANTATGVTYNGDDGQRLIQVSPSRQLAASDSGADIFMRIKNGNGTFLTQPSAANTGGSIINSGSLTTPAPTADQLGNTYTLTFTVTGSTTTYTITGVDSTGAALPTVAQPGALPTGVTYTSGQNISFNGIQFAITGTPANADQFTISPSTNESVFATISNLITTLNTATVAGDPSSPAALSMGVNRALDSLSNSLNNVLSTRASLGTRLNELDALKNTLSDRGLQYQQTLSQLQDVDYNKAITDLTRQQTMLTAAQKSFLQVQNLSLFSYL